MSELVLQLGFFFITKFRRSYSLQFDRKAINFQVFHVGFIKKKIFI